MERNQHLRDDNYHLGLEPDDGVVLAADIGDMSAGATLHEFLAALDADITDLERRFTIDAVII